MHAVVVVWVGHNGFLAFRSLLVIVVGRITGILAVGGNITVGGFFLQVKRIAFHVVLKRIRRKHHAHTLNAVVVQRNAAGTFGDIGLGGVVQQAERAVVHHALVQRCQSFVGGKRSIGRVLLCRAVGPLQVGVDIGGNRLCTVKNLLDLQCV